MKNRIIFTLSLVLVVSSLFGQRQKAVYAELLGNGILYSLNAELPIKGQFAARLGAGLIAPKGESFLYVPAHLNYVWGSKHGLELGAGIVYMRAKAQDVDTYVYPSAAVMYRYQSDGGFLFRAGIGPTFVPSSGKAEHIPGSIFLFWPGVSAGYQF